MGCEAVVVSGFLGAGKTTLVRRLLEDAQQSGVRAAVVSNELGELGVDRALLARPGESYVEIEGGCVCCRLSDELVATLEMLRERVAPERVIVETSGVALPFETQLHFWREPVSRWVEDDVSVVVVSAEQVAAGRDLDATFEQQVSSADLLVLNKVDLVGESELGGVEARIRGLEPEAPLVRAAHADVEPALLFPPDTGAARAQRRQQPAAPPPHVHDDFEASEIAVESGAPPEALLARLQALGALRCKGFVETSQGLRLVQGVGPRVELSKVESPPAPAAVGRVVVIRRVG